MSGGWAVFKRDAYVQMLLAGFPIVVVIVGMLLAFYLWE